MSRLFGLIAAFFEHATWILSGILVVLVTANVFARYALEIGVLWAEEASRLLFVWVVFLGAWVALRRKAHMAIDLLVDTLPDRGRVTVLVVGHLATLAFLCAVAVAGYQLALTTLDFGRTTPILGISAAWGYVAVPVSFTLMAVEMLGHLVTAVRDADKAWTAPRPPAPPADRTPEHGG